MADEQPALRQILLAGSQSLPEGIWAGLASSACVIALQATIAAKCGPAAWTGAVKGIRDAVAELFDITVPELLAQAWNKHGDLSKALDESKARPDDTVLLPLSEHSLQSVHQPYVEVSVDGAAERITFEVTVALQVEPATLKIKAGRIRGIEAGSCEGSVKVMFGDAVLLEKETGPIALLGPISVAQGDA